MSYETKGHRKIVGAHNTDASHTGNTSESAALCNIPIPAYTMGPNSVMWIECMLRKTGTAGTTTARAYLAVTSGSLVGATLLGSITPGGTNLTFSLSRRIANKNSMSTNNIYPVSTNNPLDATASTVAMTAINFNFAVNAWLIITVQNTSAADTGILDNAQVYVNRT